MTYSVRRKEILQTFGPMLEILCHFEARPVRSDLTKEMRYRPVTFRDDRAIWV